METLETVNRALNRCQRELNAAAVRVAASNIVKGKQALDELVQAIERVTNVQQLVVEADPNLEYHFDPARSPTPYMKSIVELVKAADVDVEKGDLRNAELLFRRALELDPPPFAYDVIEKKLQTILLSKK